jgi:hypothetical protein
MSRNEDIREQIEELEQSLRSIEKEVDAAIALGSDAAWDRFRCETVPSPIVS